MKVKSYGTIYTHIFLIILTLFLASILYTSPHYFLEVAEELQAAVEREEVTQVQANAISQWCLDNYTKGA